MKALRMHATAEPAMLVYETAPDPSLGTGDVLLEVDAAGYLPGELQWPSTWIDRSGHDRTPIVPCHEVSGVVAKRGSRGTFLVVEPCRDVLERIAERLDAGSVKPGPGASRQLEDGASAISAKELGQATRELILLAD